MGYGCNWLDIIECKVTIKCFIYAELSVFLTIIVVFTDC